MIKKGEIVIGEITNILGYGAFVQIDDYTGLIHISEFSDGFVRNIKDYVKVGQKVKLKVLDVNEKEKKLKLTYKTLHKTRGVIGEVPRFNIGFKSLAKALPEFIKEQKEKRNE
ncbi:MAG: S1 RNA-binding domain-containing protein [Bacilli bacterium]|jgi:general stress protein 13